MSGPISLDQIRSWVHPSDDWTRVLFPQDSESAQITIHTRPFPRGGILVKFELDMPESLSKDGFPLPENLGKLKDDFPEWVREVEVKRIYGPADAELTFEFGTIVHSFSKQSTVLGASIDEPLDENDQHVLSRLQVRQDYPRPDETVLVVAPIVHENGRTITLWRRGGLIAHVKYLRPHPTKTETKIFSRIMHWSSQSFPSWAVSQLNRMLTYDMRWFAWNNNPKFRDIRVSCRSRYVILCVRSLSRGFPLLLVHMDAVVAGAPVDVVIKDPDGTFSHWARFTGATFSFPEYLERFQLSMNLPHFTAYNNYNGGQRLVPYQAAVPCVEWENVRGSFQAAFARQRAAYRRLNGGSGAPKVQEVDDSKIIQEDDFSHISFEGDDNLDLFETSPQCLSNNGGTNPFKPLISAGGSLNV